MRPRGEEVRGLVRSGRRTRRRWSRATARSAANGANISPYPDRRRAAAEPRLRRPSPRPSPRPRDANSRRRPRPLRSPPPPSRRRSSAWRNSRRNSRACARRCAAAPGPLRTRAAAGRGFDPNQRRRRRRHRRRRGRASVPRRRSRGPRRTSARRGPGVAARPPSAFASSGGFPANAVRGRTRRPRGGAARPTPPPRTVPSLPAAGAAGRLPQVLAPYFRPARRRVEVPERDAAERWAGVPRRRRERAVRGRDRAAGGSADPGEEDGTPRRGVFAGPRVVAAGRRGFGRAEDGSRRCSPASAGGSVPECLPSVRSTARRSRRWPRKTASERRAARGAGPGRGGACGGGDSEDDAGRRSPSGEGPGAGNPGGLGRSGCSSPRGLEIGPRSSCARWTARCSAMNLIGVHFERNLPLTSTRGGETKAREGGGRIDPGAGEGENGARTGARECGSTLYV